MNRETQNRGLGALTGLRGIASIFVICFHYYCLYFDDPGLGLDPLPFMPYSKFFFLYSKNAVELFFMISGFLTAHHYRDKIASMSPVDYFKRHYGKLIVPSVIMTLWALINAWITLRCIPGSEAYVTPITLLRVVLSLLMINTGWVTPVKATVLPINSTLWFINILLLCYLLYYLIRKLSKKPVCVSQYMYPDGSRRMGVSGTCTQTALPVVY